MTLPVQPSQLLQMDSFDQLQIFDAAFRDKLVYEVETWDEKTRTKKVKYELTYVGIKQMIYEKSQKGEAMEILKEISTRVSIIPDDPFQDVYKSYMKVRNMKTGHTTSGRSEAAIFALRNYPHLDKSGKKQWETPEGASSMKLKMVYERRYDPFAETAALGKATRNAYRGQLPEMGIQLFVEKAIKEKGDESIQHIKTESNPTSFCTCDKGPSTKLDGTCQKCGKYSKLWWDKHNKEGGD